MIILLSIYLPIYSSIHPCSYSFSYPLFRFYIKWKEAELQQSHAQGFSLDEDQLKADWSSILSLADQKGKSLEQAHIFVLSHILRRPIIVYGVKIVKNFRGEKLGLVNFEGEFKFILVMSVKYYFCI